MSAPRYTTISVKHSTKKLLEKEKGNATWNKFLLLLLKMKRVLEMGEALTRIKKRLRKSEEFIWNLVEISGGI